MPTRTAPAVARHAVLAKTVRVAFIHQPNWRAFTSYCPRPHHRRRRLCLMRLSHHPGICACARERSAYGSVLWWRYCTVRYAMVVGQRTFVMSSLLSSDRRRRVIDDGMKMDRAYTAIPPRLQRVGQRRVPHDARVKQAATQYGSFSACVGAQAVVRLFTFRYGQRESRVRGRTTCQHAVLHTRRHDDIDSSRRHSVYGRIRSQRRLGSARRHGDIVTEAVYGQRR